MKISAFAVGLALAGIVSPASAQSLPDDVRCLWISSLFAKGASAEPQRQSALQSMLFYTGRLDGRANSRELADAFRTNGPMINPATAATEMSACAARVVRAQQALQALARAAAPGK